MNDTAAKLNGHLQKIIDLRMASAVLQWDEETYMPDEGMSSRAEQIATLNEISHGLFTSVETKTILEETEIAVSSLPQDSDEASLARVTRRDFDQATKIPSNIIAEQSRLASQSFAAWRDARETNDFAKFAPFLEKTVELNRKIADFIGYINHPYDALLAQYEPDITTANTITLFNGLKEGLIPLVKKYSNEKQPDSSFLSKPYDAAKQYDFTIDVLKSIGFDFSRGRQDKSVHPFTTNFSSGDVRITNRFIETNPLSSIFSAIHEGGHALYEMGIAASFERTNLAGGATLGLHESQSRMWENIVGRSLEFWEYFYPRYTRLFHEQLKTVSLEQFYRAINKVSPSLIRVDADELTYNIHIFIRFEIESELIEGNISVKDIPALWTEKYSSYLGIKPKNDAEGCLQDIHWAHGSFGYFPTYTIGNIISAQLYQKALRENPQLPDDFSHGVFSGLLQWLRVNVHSHGRKFTSKELVKKITGEEISVEPFLTYLQNKFESLY
jgi:carboxypeptidase Taq